MDDYRQGIFLVAGVVGVVVVQLVHSYLITVRRRTTEQ